MTIWKAIATSIVHFISRRERDAELRALEEQWRRRLDRSAVTISAIAVAASVLAAGAATYQAIIARDQEYRQLRAYITVQEFGVACAECGDTKLTLPTGITNALVSRFQNDGETPANNVYSTYNWFPVAGMNASLPVNFDFPDMGKPVGSRSDIGKGGHKDGVGPLTISGLETLKAHDSGRQTLYLYGHVDYCDVFNKPHSTAYCFLYVRGGGPNLPLCDRFNGEIAPRSVCRAP